MPEQGGTFDCGLFILKGAECHLRGQPHDYSQGDMVAIRKELHQTLRQHSSHFGTVCNVVLSFADAL